MFIWLYRMEYYEIVFIYKDLSGPMRGVFSRYVGPGPESHEGACESLKGPISLAIDVLF